MRRWPVWGWVAAVAVYIVIAVVALRGAPNGAAGPAGMSTSSLPDGCLAVARLWEKMGLPFHVWTSPPELLPKRLPGTWISVQPGADAYTERDVQAILGFAARGNHVVWVSDRKDALLRALHIQSQPVVARTVSRVTMAGTSSHRPVQRWTQLQMVVQRTLAGAGTARAVWRAQAEDGTVVGVRIRRGRGLVDIWTVPRVWENQGIGQAQNLRVVWDLSGHGPVWWDEYGHGLATVNPWSVIFGKGRGFALWSLAAAALLYLWGANTRFGRPRPTPEELPRSSAEFLHAVARQLMAGPLQRYQQQLIEDLILRRLAERLGFAQSAPWSAVERALGQRQDDLLVKRYMDWRAAMAAWAGKRRRYRRFAKATRALLVALEGGNGSRA